MTKKFRLGPVATLCYRFACVIVILVAPSLAAAYSFGSGSCDTSPTNLLVKHASTVVTTGTGSQGGYTFTINGGTTTTVKPGETATLVLSRATGYKGFLIHSTSSSGASVGGLSPINSDAQLVPFCSPTDSGVGHTSNFLKNSTTVKWTAPTNLANGEVVTFSGLVVQRYDSISSVYYTLDPIRATVRTVMPIPSVGFWGLVALGFWLGGYTLYRMRRPIV